MKIIKITFDTDDLKLMAPEATYSKKITSKKRSLVTSRLS